MIRKLAVFVFILLLLPNPTLAENPELNLNISIKTYEYADANVVGDHFYFEIFLTNPTSEIISDDFSISVYNPHDDAIGTRNFENISIEPKQSYKLIAGGEYENETAILPFEIAGDYKIVFESNKSIDFYNFFKMEESEKSIQYNFVRQNTKYEHYFDVMPKWQYNLWKEEEKINIDMYEATQEMNAATNIMIWATLAMLIVSLINLYIVIKKR